ncbi:MAG TPA: ribosomal-processing cysteine protease Prp [Bacilli bacterium]
MIRVIVTRQAVDRSIRAFSVTGHANFAEAGKDIVCAGVSAITVGTVNAIQELLHVALPAAMRKGKLAVELPQADAIADSFKDVQLLLEAMLVSLQSIKESYGPYIEIQEEFI